MSEWKETVLGEFISLRRGHDLPQHERQPGTVPVVGSGGVTGWHNASIVSGPGITIGRAANLGVPTLVESDFWPLNTTLYVTDFHGNSVYFTYYLLRVLDLTGFNSGSVQPMLNRNYIHNFPICVPSRRGQDAIARILMAFDEKIVVNGRIVDSIHGLGDAFVRSALLGQVSSSSIGDLVRRRELEFGDGYRTKRAEHGKPGFPILRVAEVLDGRIVPSLVDYVSERYRSAIGVKLSRPGDVVLTTKGTVGRVAIIPADSPEFAYSPQLCYFRSPSGSSLSMAYLYFWFRSEAFWAQARSLKSQTDMADYLNLADIRSLMIGFPEIEEYRDLCAKLATLIDVAAQRNSESESLAQLRDTLLPKLISGEIRVRDAEKIVENAT